MANEFDPTDPPMDTEAWDDMAAFTLTYPPKVSATSSLWSGGPQELRLYTLPMTETRLIAVFLYTQLLHFLLRRFGFSRITSEMLAGSALTIYATNGEYQTFVEEIINVMARFNYIFFLFLMGVKLDITSVRNKERKIWAFGILIVLLPLALTQLATFCLSNKYHFIDLERSALTKVSVTYSMSSFAAVVYLVSELRILNSELGKVALSVATISDLVGMFFYYLNSHTQPFMDLNFGHKIDLVVLILLYIAFLLLVIRPVSFWVIKQTPEGSPVNGNYVFLIVATAFGFAGVFGLFGFNIYIAPYLLGLAIPSGPPLGSALEARYNSFIVHLFLPFFVSICASYANVRSINLDHTIWRVAAFLLLLILVSKFVTAFVLALCCKLPSRDALVLSLILSSKGVVEIANYTNDLESHVIPLRLFGMAFAFIFVTCAMVPVLVKNLYDPSKKYAGYRRRNLMDLNSDGEIPILACVYARENISPMVKLIDSCAARPLAVNALHLLTLEGQSNPVFISHDLQPKSFSNYAKSKDVILSFKALARKNPSVTSLNVFTSISPPYSMSEDICTLALDKRASIIILPFHRMWTMDGHEVDDNANRSLNHSLLHRSPCSIGVLVDRGHIGRSVSPLFNIAMIFLGGKDDREALTLAKRMVEKPDSTLSVIRIICNSDQGNMNWECILDSEVLKDVKGGRNIMYTEILVENGNDLIGQLRDMVSSYSLVMVGRRLNERTRCTEGLEVWSDFPELGVIGDLLTSGEFGGDYSVLVVKQQVRVGSK